MKVLGLVASPRKLGNSEILVKEMLLSLPPETEKAMIRLPQLNVEYCNACYSCLPSGKSCVLKDDLQFLLDHIKSADCLIIASPCYFLGPHTSIKMIGDRLISILNNGDDFCGKKCVTVTVYGIDGWEGYAREGLLNFARFLHLDVVGSMSVKAASPGEAAKPEILMQARELAQALICPGGSGAACLNTCPVCGNTLLQIGFKGEVRCVMCNAKGTLACENGEVRLNVGPESHPRFSRDGMDEHGRILEQIKADYISARSRFAKIRKPYQAWNWWIAPDSKV